MTDIEKKGWEKGVRNVKALFEKSMKGYQVKSIADISDNLLVLYAEQPGKTGIGGGCYTVDKTTKIVKPVSSVKYIDEIEKAYDEGLAIDF